MVDPIEANRAHTITIFGKNFGFSLGKIIFTFSDGTVAVGDTSFPAACVAAGYWRDDRITIKVPSVFTNGKVTENGKYKIRVVRPDTSASNEVDFSVNTTLKPAPGICAITPSVGPHGTPITILGERFGADKPAITFYLRKILPFSHTRTSWWRHRFQMARSRVY